jgi:hypothetical protein
MKSKAMIQCLKNMGAGSNALCLACRSENPDISNALGPWFTSDRSKNGDCIAFVGKIARGEDIGELISERLEDVEPFGTNFIKESNWAYWAYTRDIMERVFGSLDSAMLSTSFTNLIKCNNSTTLDTSTQSQKNYCIRENEFVLKELEIVSPKAVVFFVGTDYDEYIRLIRPKNAVRYEDEADIRIAIGAKQLPWWSRKYFAADGSLITRFLRIGHPERMKKEPYVDEVAQWIVESLDLYIPNEAVKWA